MSEIVLELKDITKNYGALRPLRIKTLTITAGERVAISGLDAGAAEIMVNLVTGASVADRGQVRVLGRSNADIANGDEWLASLDQFGIVSDRAVLLEGATLEQNLAMPFTLAVDPRMAARVAALAVECGMVTVEDAGSVLQTRAGEAAPEVRARAHLARAVALDPVLLVLEHPTAQVPEAARAAYAADIARVVDARHLAALILTQDQAFAQVVGHRTLRLHGGTGALTPVKRGWFS